MSFSSRTPLLATPSTIVEISYVVVSLSVSMKHPQPNGVKFVERH